MRISFQLTDAVTQATLWSESYDRVVSDPLDVQSQIASLVRKRVEALLLRRGIGTGGREIASEPATSDAEDGSDEALTEAPAQPTTARPEPAASPEQARATAAPSPEAADEAGPLQDGDSTAVPTASSEETYPLEVYFRSEMLRGIVLIFADDKEILRRRFEFVQRKGLFRRTVTDGEFRETVQLAGVPGELRIYVTPQGEASRYVRLAPEWPAEGGARLDIRLTKSGEASASLLTVP